MEKHIKSKNYKLKQNVAPSSKTGDLASRSERNAALIRTLFEAFRDRHKEYTNLRILAANKDTLLATKSCDALHHLGSCSRYRKCGM